MSFYYKSSGRSLLQCPAIKKGSMLSAWMSFILYRACCYIHASQNTQVIFPECFSFSLPHLIFTSVHLPFFMIVAISCCTYLSPLLLFISVSHIKLQQWPLSACNINYFVNLLHEQLYFPLHKFWSMAVQYVVTNIFLNMLPWTFKLHSIHILH
jgi:hypothetical protein